MGKFKIINDPVHGFIRIDNPLDFEIITHIFFQRLRRISQLGLTSMVYPGALHTRFHHALGAYHLMKESLYLLRNKGVEISKEEFQSACTSILLHDIGHGPFSHTLEHSIIRHTSHESISLRLMEFYNIKFEGKLDLVIAMFKGEYSRPFFHQLISGPLDVDRMDYLKRDSFFTGVSEGVINTDRIISMANVVNDQLVFEEKALYSLEKFLLARRFMYSQVYLHKAVVACESMLVLALKRAKNLMETKGDLFTTTHLKPFLSGIIEIDHPQFLDNFCNLDDFDILVCLKEWKHYPDKILSLLSSRILERRLFKLHFLPWSQETRSEAMKKILQYIAQKEDISVQEAKFLCFEGSVATSDYSNHGPGIQILMKSGKVEPLENHVENINLSLLNKEVPKSYICLPEEYRDRIAAFEEQQIE